MSALSRVTALVLSVMVVCLLSLAAPARATQITDDRGVTVSFPSPPQRVVSLLPSLAETVCALDQCQRLVGVDRYSNYPTHLKLLPQVGGGLDPNIEAIVALQPDVVLMARSGRGSERMESLGLKVVTLEPKTHAEMQRVILTLGQLFGVVDAPRIWRALDAGVLAAAQSLPVSARGTRVYFEVNDGPYAAGESSFIGETLARLGVRNIVPVALGVFPKLNPEFVVRANPDVIMVSARSAQAMQARPGWQSLAALRAQRLCIFNSEEGDILVRPGPRMAEGARIMANCLTKMAPRVTPTR